MSGGCIQLVGTLSPLEVIDDLQDISAVLVLACGEADLAVPFNVIEQVIVNRLEGLIKDFKVISCQHVCQLLNVVKVPVSILGKSLVVVFMVPS